MVPEGMDPSLLQDFLTESSELLEKLDADLVTLEGVGEGDQQKDLLNGIFRALHTIKGAASFLGLSTLTAFAHVAEDTLNRLRKGEVSVTTEVMDALLRSVDVLRNMLEQIDHDEAISPAPEELIAKLHAIVGGEQDPAEAPDKAAPPSEAGQSSPTEGAPLNLPREKADLIEFMIIDLDQSIDQIRQCIDGLRSADTRSDAADRLGDVAEDISKTGQFFDVKCLAALASMLRNVAGNMGSLPDQILEEVLIRLEAVNLLIKRQTDALGRGVALEWPLETLEQRLSTLIEDATLDDNLIGQHQNNVERVLELDGVVAAMSDTSTSPSMPAESAAPAVSTETTAPSTDEASTKKMTNEAPASRASVGEQTIRVEVGRLESLLNLVGRLVLNKNRVLALSRKLRESEWTHMVEEQFTAAASDLDQLTSELQVGVMRTRMQPLAKLFDRYPRVIRDMARMTDKKINLDIQGKETEVDKSVLEVLADPLVHILRNSADHGVETPDRRTEVGKLESGTIRLSAEHQGSHVRVEICDDGKGLDRNVIGAKAVEKGLVSVDQVAAMSDEEVFLFIFAAGFSTAEKVTDLSGRGVGMDVVRTNIAKINGTINVSSVKGKGTTIEILIPLTVAIMPAMMVGVGQHLYAVPLTSIIEIVRPEEKAVHSVGGQPVMRLRDIVLPLLDLKEKLKEVGEGNGSRFAVVVGVGQQRAGLLVDRLIGQQEIVIKPLDDRYTRGGPFSGATIRDDGNVSLILDVIQLIREAQTLDRAAA